MALVQNKTTYIVVVFICLNILLSCVSVVSSLSSVTISETGDYTLVCALQTGASGHPQSFLNCTSFPQGIHVPHSGINVSYSQIVSGNGFLCALRPLTSSSTSIMVCWRFANNGTTMTYSYKRIYHGPALKQIDSGTSRVCGVANVTNLLQCWPWSKFKPNMTQKYTSVAVGENFVCGLSKFRNIICKGNDNESAVVGQQPNGNYTVVAAGFSHACAIGLNGSLSCWGDVAGEVPQGEFNSLALGESRSCAIRLKGTAVCWGANNFSLPESLQESQFIGIEAKSSVFCGIMSSSYSLFCWGRSGLDSSVTMIENVLPGTCTSDSCPCGPLLGSATLCSEGMFICKPCDNLNNSPPLHEPPMSPSTSPSPSPLPSPSSPSRKNGWRKKMVAFLVIGCVGSSSVLLAFGFFMFRHCRNTSCRVHDSGRLDEPTTTSQQQIPQNLPQPNTSVLENRVSHLFSTRHRGSLEVFSWEILVESTNNFSESHKIGTGSFGSVYHAKLQDGREVAIKRAEVSSTTQSYGVIGGTKRQEDKENAFLNELESLSRVNHKNLVRLLGFFVNKNERILVYEYMNNGTLHDQIHKLQTSSLISWSSRIKVALDAARGIEYLHEYTTPPIIHRDIKSSNILLDTNLTAKVSDFGLSLMGPQDEKSHLSLVGAGTVGYMDPEYYRLQQLTSKSDVYSFGVVLLELLSGNKAIHKNENEVPRNVVDFVVPYIIQDEIHMVLDPKVPPPTSYEIEAVAYVGYLAADCVTMKGIERPTMREIVSSLERALVACLTQPFISRSSTSIT